MKRWVDLCERLAEWSNLERALGLAIKGKRDRHSTVAFMEGMPGTLEAVGRRLRSGLGPLGRYRDFVIHDPKLRLISAPCFEDRVLHQAVMGVCEPAFERWLIRQTFACRVGRGLRAAVNEAAYWTDRRIWYLQLDVRHYFETIPRSRLMEKVERLFGEVEMLRLWWELIDSHRPGQMNGLPIGALTQPRRRVQQHGGELPCCQSQRERSVQPEQQPGPAPCSSLSGLEEVDSPPEGTRGTSRP